MADDLLDTDAPPVADLDRDEAAAIVDGFVDHLLAAGVGPGETIDVHLEIGGFDKNDDRANIRWKVTAIRTGS